MSNKKSKVLVIIGIVSIVLAILITYKIINPSMEIPEPDIEEYPVSSSKYIKKQQSILKGIVDNFNNKELIKKYIGDKDVIKATVDGNTIVVDYKYDNVKEQFVFILDDNILNINIDKNKVKVFDSIFRLMIVANQHRLNNTSDLSNFFKIYKNDNLLTTAVIISSSDNEIEYIININKKIK